MIDSSPVIKSGSPIGFGSDDRLNQVERYARLKIS